MPIKEKAAKNRYVFLEALGLTELKLARKFMKLEKNEGKWIYNTTRKKWMYWDEPKNIWVEDNETIMYKRIAEFVEDLSLEYTNWDYEDKEWNKVERFLEKTQSAQGLRNIINCCMAEARIISETDLDADPYLINFKNGFYSLKTNSFYPADPDSKKFLLTKRCEVEYLYGQSCELWKKTLDEIFLYDQEYIEYIQRIFGYALLGKDKEHSVFIINGEGRNGKTTLLNVMAKIMGDYYKTIPDDAFTEKGKDKNLVLAELYATRFAHIAEAEKGAKLVLSLLKRISGGSPVSGRRHHEQYFTYQSGYKIFIETNENPAIGDDIAMWERVHNIKFPRYFEAHERDKNLGEKLQEELPGILQWLLEGWRKYQEHGLSKPDKAIKDTQDHRNENDMLKHFLNDCFTLTVDEDDYIKGEPFYQIYVDWVNKNQLTGRDRLNGIQFGREMKKRKDIVYKASKRVNGNPVGACYCFLKKI